MEKQEIQELLFDFYYWLMDENNGELSEELISIYNTLDDFDIDHVLFKFHNFCMEECFGQLRSENIYLFLKNEYDFEDDKSDIEKIIERLEEEVENYSNPGTYMDDEYYVRCKAKAEAFEEVISIIKNMK